MPGEEAHAVACLQTAREFTSSGEERKRQNGSCDGDRKHAREGDSVPALAGTDKGLKTTATQKRFKTPPTDQELKTPATHKVLLSERKSYLKKGLTKLFKGGYFEGTVEEYDAERDVYKIIYVDDDDEEMTYEEMKALVIRAMGCEGGGRADESRRVVARQRREKVEMAEQGRFYVAQENDTPRKRAKQLATCGAGNVPGAEKLAEAETADGVHAPACHAPVCHAPAGEHGAEGRACSVAGRACSVACSPAAGLPARKRTQRESSGLRWADDAPSGELYSVEYVETLHGLPLDASERERRAFFASLHRSKLRQRAAKGSHGKRRTEQHVEPTKPVTHSAAYLLCKGGVQGARQSAQALEMELRMSEMI
jgi:hypothetical protein